MGGPAPVALSKRVLRLMSEQPGDDIDHTEIYKQAVAEWGREAQIMMAIEECSELIKELTKLYRGDTVDQNVAEEVADVEIMMEQMHVLFGDKRVHKHKLQKLDRLNTRLEWSQDTATEQGGGSDE